MTSSPDNDTGKSSVDVVPVSEFYELKGKLTEMEVNTAKIRASESKFHRFFSYILVTIAAFSGLANYAFFKMNADSAAEAMERSESEVMRVVSKSEDYIEALTKMTQPDYAKISGISLEGESVVDFGVYVNRIQNGGVPRYVLGSRGDLLAEVFGASGRFVGVQFYFAGDIVDLLSESENNRMADTNLHMVATPQYSYEEGDGIFVVPDVKLTVAIHTRTYFSSCLLAEKVLEALVSSTSTSNVVNVKPVFERIRSPAVFSPFKANFFDARITNCTHFEASDEAPQVSD